MWVSPWQGGHHSPGSSHSTPLPFHASHSQHWRAAVSPKVVPCIYYMMECVTENVAKILTERCWKKENKVTSVLPRETLGADQSEWLESIFFHISSPGKEDCWLHPGQSCLEAHPSLPQVLAPGPGSGLGTAYCGSTYWALGQILVLCLGCCRSSKCGETDPSLWVLVFGAHRPHPGPALVCITAPALFPRSLHWSMGPESSY